MSKIPQEAIEAAAWTHPNGAIWRTDNLPDWVNVDKEGWEPLYSRPPAPQPTDRQKALTSEEKEQVLLRIIEGMGGETDSSEHPGQWLNWFCNDEIAGDEADTFNRCNDKGWLSTSHCTDFDTSTTWLTKEGRAALAGGEARADAARAQGAEVEPVAITDTDRLDFLDQCNARLNARYKTRYGWKMIMNHNVNRLMTGRHLDVDLQDAEANGSKSCRDAIDAEIRRIKAARAVVAKAEGRSHATSDGRVSV